ncbi:hypothetical protein LWM68_23785 [Niabella sp. W65]|nr:hypothetical protein [Niabella sp. W65]MCH7365524.1 hypothetical protein [Niabella sp. W65]ULT41307.1 hypothetical protein KRR40_42670 [Niabella sp. I65]
MRKGLKLLAAGVVCSIALNAQTALVNTAQSKYAKLSGVGLGDVQWTKGFWAERFDVLKNSMVPTLWRTYTSDTICYSFQNFKVAAGLQEGRFRGRLSMTETFIKPWRRWHPYMLLLKTQN